MKKLIFTLAALVLTGAAQTTKAQEFAEKTSGISYKKSAYIYLENGDSIIGPLTKIGYRKGVIDELKMEVGGKKKEIDVATIKNAYFPLSNAGKLDDLLTKGSTASKWEKTGVNEALIRDGYVFYEKSIVMIKNKPEPLLMQLVNPAFGDKIRVYADQFANESNSYGVGGVTLTGGDDLSYYFKKGDKPAEKISKKGFKEKIPELFGDCPTLVEKLNKDYSWTDLPKYVYEHSNCAP